MKKLFICLCIVFLVGCATAPIVPYTPIQDTFTINNSYDKVWKAVINTVTEFMEPIKIIEKDSGLLITEFVSLGNRYNAAIKIKSISYPPKLLMPNWGGCRYSYTINISKIDDNNTKIKILSNINGYDEGFTKKWYVCQSRGVIEENIFNKITEYLE